MRDCPALARSYYQLPVLYLFSLKFPSYNIDISAKRLSTMINRSGLPSHQQNQVNLGQEYTYDGGTEYTQDIGFQADWRGDQGPQHPPTSFQRNQTTSHATYSDGSGQQISDRNRYHQLQQLRPPFAVPSLETNSRDSSNEGYGRSSLSRVSPVDFGSRFLPAHSSSSLSAPSYPSSAASQQGQYPGHNDAGGVRPANNSYAQDTPPPLRNRHPANERLVT
jgi:hypothetical protein